jgi:hypothetical protein
MFLMFPRNQKMLNNGHKLSMPQFNKSCRVLEIEYNTPLRLNSIVDLTPCASIIVILALRLPWLREEIHATTNPIWATEEYAIKILKSVCQTHATLIKAPPIRAHI